MKITPHHIDQFNRYHKACRRVFEKCLEKAVHQQLGAPDQDRYPTDSDWNIALTETLHFIASYVPDDTDFTRVSNKKYRPDIYLWFSYCGMRLFFNTKATFPADVVPLVLYQFLSQNAGPMPGNFKSVIKAWKRDHNLHDALGNSFEQSWRELHQRFIQWTE